MIFLVEECNTALLNLAVKKEVRDGPGLWQKQYHK